MAIEEQVPAASAPARDGEIHALLLVRRIAARWGVDHGRLWFEVDDRDCPSGGA